MIFTLVALLLVISSPIITSAFPSGVGSCLPGKGAIQQGAHANLLQPAGGTSIIGNAGFQVFIDGKQVYENVYFEFTAGDTHTIELVATEDIMRGFLLTLESVDGQDTRDAFTSTDSQVTVPFFCTETERVGGLGHVGRQPKTKITGTLYMAKPSNDLDLHVTTVVSTIYSYGRAEWYVSQFKLRAVAQGTSITYQTGSTTSAGTAPQCTVANGYCTIDGACCTGRCIRELTDNVWANGVCQTGLASNSGVGQINGTPSSSTTAPCLVSSDCPSKRCVVINGVGTCGRVSHGTKRKQSLSRDQGGASAHYMARHWGRRLGQ